MLDTSAVIAYLGGDFTPNYETVREAATTFLTDSDEPTGALSTPAALTAAAPGTSELRALLWIVAVSVNDETVPLGARVYVGDVADVPTLLVRRL